MQIKIQRAKKGDIEQIIELEKKLFLIMKKYDPLLDKFNETRIKNYLIKNIGTRNYLSLCAKKDDKIVGFLDSKIDYKKPWMKEKIGFIEDVYVLPKYRKTGIAKKMITTSLKWFKKRKIKHVELKCWIKNKIGLKIWESLGFKEIFKRFRKRIW